jgi:hypothetical protein
MCGPKFCSMHHSRTIDDGIAQLAKEMAEKEASEMSSRSGPAPEQFAAPEEIVAVGGDD